MGKKKKNRENLPEGMSRKQAKLAARAAERAALMGETRPFEGLAAEPQLVALQEFIPSAYAKVDVAGTDREVYICTVLPGAVAALVRDEEAGGEAFVAMQTQHRTKTQGKDLAYALNWVINAAPGATLAPGNQDGSQPELSALLSTDAELDVQAFDTFNWWVPEGQTGDEQTARMLQMANDTIIPSQEVHADVPGALWWVDPGEKAHIRWVRQDNEDKLLAALARIAAAGKLHLGEDTKFAGAFRTHGLTVPVFDLDPTITPEECVPAVEELNSLISAELSNDAQLNAEERKALNNIKSRQLTIR
ncbi:DUF5926 family protein [Corynebacterium sp. TAE3-ERU30]|uniref:DUF5926 family protein n=1 Tax=Corynebacterium sp. TAE3-ERU30 TaxID=2849496 RepID=UPI001C47486F|nr:DUF5926 family protein [Corynebacterium sp. TAE3-ERU30]MBV7282197.1 preprotein translocase subunit SecA [Corynebacterium sp. TAE3-ERU30]